MRLSSQPTQIELLQYIMSKLRLIFHKRRNTSEISKGNSDTACYTTRCGNKGQYNQQFISFQCVICVINEHVLFNASVHNNHHEVLNGNISRKLKAVHTIIIL